MIIVDVFIYVLNALLYWFYACKINNLFFKSAIFRKEFQEMVIFSWCLLKLKQHFTVQTADS